MWQYYQFKDAAQQVVLFGQQSEPEEIQANILAKATELNVPVSADDIKISRNGSRTIAEGSYVQAVPFFPNYPYPVKFTFLVDAVSLGGPLPSGRK